MTEVNLLQLSGLQDLLSHVGAHSISDQLGDGMAQQLSFQTIGHCTVQQAQDLIMEHARTKIGHEKVESICATLIRFYFGGNTETGNAGQVLSSCSGYLRMVQCTFHRQGGSSPTAWRASRGPHLVAIAIQELIGLMLQYAELFKKDMNLRGLLLTMDPARFLTERTGNYGSENQWSFQLTVAENV